MLILNPGLLASFGDDHLLAALDCEPDILCTAVERELAGRLEAALDDAAQARELMEACGNFTPEPTAADILALGEAHTADWSECAKMLALLNDAEIETAEQLKALIESTKEKTQ